jgi:hypothetical protein
VSLSAIVRLGDPVHAAFQSWLATGADGDPEPATALHAVACESCRNAVAAVDSLQVMDTARADLPALAPPQVVPPPRWRWAMHVFPAAAVLVLALAQIAGSGTVMAPGTVAGNGAPAFWPDFFGGAGGIPSLFGSPSPSDGVASESDGPSPTDEQQVAPGQGFPPGVPVPPTLGPPLPTPPPGVTPPPGTPSGSSAPSASTAPTPPATQPPTPPPPTPPPPTPPPPTPPPPTPEPPTPPPPTPEPTPPPPPQAPECSDGIDNDGDGLIDWGLDPLVNETIDCLGPDDNSEALL